jgi:hypothetical protein
MLRLSMIVGIVGALALSACASELKIHGGPQECVQMCRSWNMELTGMVGVGNQDATGPGATACVCQVPSSGGETPGTAPPVASAGTASTTAAVIVALQEAERQRQQAQQQQRQAALPRGY